MTKQTLLAAAASAGANVPPSPARCSAAKTNGQTTAPAPHVKFSKLSAEDRRAGLLSDTHRFVQAMVKPSPMP